VSFDLFDLRPLIRPCILFAVLAWVPASLRAADSNPATNAPAPVAPPAVKVTSDTGPIIEATRENLTKWVETKQMISKEKTEWTTGKDILEDRVRLAQAETATVRETPEPRLFRIWGDHGWRVAVDRAVLAVGRASDDLPFTVEVTL
jgi:hypothetical protein